jgi:hypothetical protein
VPGTPGQPVTSVAAPARSDKTNARVLRAEVKGTATSECGARALARVSSERSTALGYGWTGVAVLLGAGLAAAVLWARRRDAERGNAEQALGVTNDAAARERAVLVRACVQASDTVPSDALREQLLDALSEAGVTPVDVAAGEQFDSARHRAVGRVATTDRSRDNLVAKIERAGYLDHGRRLRTPDVLVFNADEHHSP